ncbi:MAG: TolB family protein, partial [Saprospiraceae bacterium]
PLWMIEGLAEYMSIGRVDANTSLWMRDAVLNDKVPTLKDLYNPEYFPYRWGQAFWAFLAGMKGDDIIAPFFVATAKYGFEDACKQVLNMSSKDLSKLWVNTLKDHYGKYIGDRKERFIGSPLITKKKQGGRLHIAPMLSPNGKYVLFLSEKDLFSIDIFLANAVNGKIIRKIHSATKNGHLDDLDFIESAGTWAPDSRRIAFVAVRKGQNVLVIKDIKGKMLETFEIPGVPAFSNPAWSPDGKSIVVAGLVNGQVDLYEVFLKNKKVVQLTDDRYSEMAPAWSADGTQLAFATDQLSLERNTPRLTFNIAVMKLASATRNPLSDGSQGTPKSETTIFDFFFGADNLNPVFDADGNLLFLSDHDGFRNLYKYEFASGKIFQLTDFLTGISGITPYAPAITASTNGKRNRVFFTHYRDGGYNIYRAKSEQFLHREVAPDSVNLAAATLPKVNRRATDIVDANLDAHGTKPTLTEEQMNSLAYRPKFQLDYIGGGAGVGVGFGQSYGGTATGMAGSVD